VAYLQLRLRLRVETFALFSWCSPELLSLRFGLLTNRRVDRAVKFVFVLLFCVRAHIQSTGYTYRLLLRLAPLLYSGPCYSHSTSFRRTDASANYHQLQTLPLQQPIRATADIPRVRYAAMRRLTSSKSTVAEVQISTWGGRLVTPVRSDEHYVAVHQIWLVFEQTDLRRQPSA